ncbi:phage holin family protein [Lysobacter sp. GX 14042]|uniref:phage holin family protein n=1 Tax=Lysobacter sp. GX 14042 TaxID=2907155 RepID=UPI001F198030|nr:phage holin family protein [Lysobacter sp. GX 14042]MCE7032036.1 phage holin family protein [Lysobacter sp. GX 14042]
MPGAADAGGEEVDPRPDLLQALREIGEGSRASLDAAGEVAKSLRSLVAADVALARSAAGRAAVAGGVALVGGVTAWLFLMGTLVMLLRSTGLSWWLSMLLPALASLVIAGIGGWLAIGYYEHTRLQATRRQLARLGIGELSRFVSDPDSARSAREDAEQAAAGDATGQPARDSRGVEVTPP